MKIAIIVNSLPDTNLVQRCLESHPEVTHIDAYKCIGDFPFEETYTVVLFNLRFNIKDGAEIVSRIKEVIRSPVIIISDTEDPGVIEAAFRAGAKGFLRTKIFAEISAYQFISDQIEIAKGLKLRESDKKKRFVSEWKKICNSKSSNGQDRSVAHSIQSSMSSLFR